LSKHNAQSLAILCFPKAHEKRKRAIYPLTHHPVFISIPSSCLPLSLNSPYLFCLHCLSLGFPFSLSFSYLKPYGLIVTMCVFDDYSGSSVRLLKNFTITHRGGNGRHTHVQTSTCITPVMTPDKRHIFKHKEEAISRNLLLVHVIVVNIFIS